MLEGIYDTGNVTNIDIIVKATDLAKKTVTKYIRALTFDRITYYNGYRDRDLLTPEQIETLRKEGPMGCIGF